MRGSVHLAVLGIALLIATAPLANPQSNSPASIDLTAALRLAGAQNLDVAIAQQKLREAVANEDSARWQFLPWLSPGISYRRHEGLIQDVSGNMLDVEKDSYAPGATLAAQADVGAAYFQSLAARQLTRAANLGVESERQAAVMEAAANYFELALAGAAADVAADSVLIASNQVAQLEAAVGAGVAFKGDQLRAQVQLERNRLAHRQSLEQRRVAGSRLALTLRLDPAIELVPRAADLLPMTLIDTNAALSQLVAEAQAKRPEIEQNQALTAAVRKQRTGAIYGPAIPRLDAQAFLGGLGGGRDDGPHEFDSQMDAFVGLSWRLGPGGLFDSTRRRASEARLQTATLQSAKTHDAISQQVVEAYIRSSSARDRLATARSALTLAEQSLQLTTQRRTYGVGVVLENLKAEEDLTEARHELLRAIADYNIAQYKLLRATGRL